MWFAARWPTCVHDLSLCWKGNSSLTKLLGGFRYEKIWRYNNSPPCVAARWLPQQIPPLNFLGFVSESSMWYWICCVYQALHQKTSIADGFSTWIKGAQSYYSKLRFHLYVGNLYSTGVNLKFWLNQSKPFRCTKQFCKFQLHILFCISLVMVTITSHILIAIFPREYLLAIKFLMGNEKNTGHLLILKSRKV